jgi:hypothetical protein
MKWKLLIGALFSSLFVYIAVKGTSTSELQAGLKQADYNYLLPIFLLSIFGMYLRSYRWGIIIHPLEKIHQKVLFPITVVGLMAVVLLPMRAGEIVRPYLVSKRSEIHLSSALGTVVVERVFDGLTLMLFLLLIAFFTELPGWAYQAGLFVLFFFLLILFVLALLIFRRDFSSKWIGFMLKRFPERIAGYVMRMLNSFIDGLKVLPDTKRVMLVVFLSILVWLSTGFSIYLLFHSFHLSLPLVAAYVVLVLTALGLLVPTAPGFVGNFHLFCIIGLALFGISKAEALSFAILLHIIQVGLVGILGLAFIPFIKIPFSEIIFARKRIRN